jgi:glycosyltransferase involved in cell wall biosynthesis
MECVAYARSINFEKRTMRICLVSLRALPALSEEHKHERVGGEEVQHAQLAAALVRLGHDVRLVVADFGQRDGAVYEGVTTLRAFKESAGLPGLRYIYPQWTGLWSAIARADADVYYYSCAGMILGMLAMYCDRNNRRLVFRVARDDDCDLDRVEIRYRRDRWLYQYGLNRTDAVLVQTITQQQDLLKNFGLPSTVAGMLVARPFPSASPMAKDVDVLWVANLRKVKRPDRLLELARAMPGVRFHMAGAAVPGEEDLFRLVEAGARELPNLTFHGGVPYKDVGKLFDRARIFANTSELEGFPNTYLQAWVRGVPVVTTFDPDGLVKSAGLGSSHASVPEMIRGLEQMLHSEVAYESARGAALQFMEQRFGEKTVLVPYLDAIMGSKSARLR